LRNEYDTSVVPDEDYVPNTAKAVLLVNLVCPPPVLVIGRVKMNGGLLDKWA
jgi:hypothetical protein